MGMTPTGEPTSGRDEGDMSGERRQLFVVTDSSSWRYPLPVTGEVLIGRSEDAHVRLDDAQVSHQHAQLVLEGTSVTIRDLGSSWGTFVNRVPLTGERTLEPNDVIMVHQTMMIFQAGPTRAANEVVLEMAELRKRVEDDIERATSPTTSPTTRDHRFSVLCIAGIGPGERSAAQTAVIAQLRRGDSVAWSSQRALYVLLPGTGREESIAIAARIRGTLDRRALQIGHVTCPIDGFDAEALIAGAYHAASVATPDHIAALERTFRTLTLGGQRVIVADPTVTRLYALVERLAPAGIPVLIAGETGCGKELVATALHILSPRAGHRLISLNCAALHETLVESELFGHERGAFSGAVATKPGLIEAASGSTLFLDEIGELTLANQAKLLRVLESHRVTRVGDVRERVVDVRVVAATNRDLEADVAAGRFRRDLYFRLSAATLYLPPLRQRTHELPLLAAAFLEEACRVNARPVMRICDDAMAVLLGHAWPGNVRELKNLMQYVAAAIAGDELRAEQVSERLGRLHPAAVRSEPTATAEPRRFRPLADELRELEITRIREALVATGGNQTRAAQLLAMPVRTFFDKAKHYGLTPKKKRYDH